MTETSFADTPRVKGKPFSKRVGDNLLERTKGGHVRESFGYFNPSQVAAREAVAKRLFRYLRSNLLFPTLAVKKK